MWLATGLFACSQRLLKVSLTNCLRCRARTQPESAFLFLFARIGTDSIPEDQAPPHRAGLAAQTAEDAAQRPAQIPTAPGRSRGHSAQDYADLPQGVLP